MGTVADRWRIFRLGGGTWAVRSPECDDTPEDGCAEFETWAEASAYVGALSQGADR